MKKEIETVILSYQDKLSPSLLQEVMEEMPDSVSKKEAEEIMTELLNTIKKAKVATIFQSFMVLTKLMPTFQMKNDRVMILMLRLMEN